jgi:hypothetical protein
MMTKGRCLQCRLSGHGLPAYAHTHGSISGADVTRMTSHAWGTGMGPWSLHACFEEAMWERPLGGGNARLLQWLCCISPEAYRQL